MNDSPALEVLLVEDSAADVRLTREALKDGHIHGRLTVVEDGVAALSYLRREGPYRDARRPDVVLLDINLPRMDGYEVLRRIKTDPDLRSLRVVILTASESDRDRRAACDGHADGYLTKPVAIDGFLALLAPAREVLE